MTLFHLCTSKEASTPRFVHIVARRGQYRSKNKGISSDAGFAAHNLSHVILPFQGQIWNSVTYVAPTFTDHGTFEANVNDHITFLSLADYCVFHASIYTSGMPFPAICKSYQS